MYDIIKNQYNIKKDKIKIKKQQIEVLSKKSMLKQTQPITGLGGLAHVPLYLGM